jgi:hypothetical protein
MLENINLGRKLSREEYQRALPGLQVRLYDLEKACWDEGVPTSSRSKDETPREKARPSAHSRSAWIRAASGSIRSPRLAPMSSISLGGGAFG